MKNILMLNYEFPPLGGGAGNATYYLLKEFIGIDNFFITLVTSSTNSYREEEFSKNIKIYYLDIGKNNNLHYQTKRDLLIYSWKAYWFCKKLKKNNNFDLVHAFFGIPCGYIAMKLRLPYIVSLRGSDVPFYNKRFYWLDKIIFKRLSRRIWKRSSAVIVNSWGLGELAKKTSPSQYMEIIYNGIDIREFYPLLGKRRKKILKIISVGRLIKRKGFSYLIEAIKDVLDVELIIVGDGPLKEELEYLAKKLFVNVIFVGKKSHEQIVYYLQNADIFVSPSLNEGMSNAVLEAMACGLPVVVTNTGGSVELIRNNGFIVAKASPGALREVLVKYTKNFNLLSEHGKKSREIAKQMSWEKVFDQYLKIYVRD